MDCRVFYVFCLTLVSHALFAASSTVSAPNDAALSITNVDGAFVLSWPVTAADWVLEEASDVQPLTFWRRVSPRSYASNDVFRYVRVSGGGASGFYRLRKVGPPLPGVSGQWQLDEGAGEFSEDGSTSGTFMFFTNATWATGRIGPGALRFNGGGPTTGSKAWVRNDNHHVLPSSGQPFSVSLWFSPDAAKEWQALAGSAANGSNGWQIALHSPGPGTNYVVFAGDAGPGSLSVTGRTLLLPEQWYELTVTHDGSEGRIYLDSALLGREIGSVVMHDGPVYFGGGVRSYDSFSGRIDEIRFYTNCLTHEEISLTGSWRFDENTGLFITDTGTKGNHGSVTDAMGWVPGREGSGLELTTRKVVIGNEQYTVLPGSGGAFSISLWLRPNSLRVGRNALMSCGTGTNDGWQLTVELDDSGQHTMYFASTNCGGTLDLAAPVALTNGAWTKLDATYNGGIATIYTDGRKVQARNGAIRGSRGPLVVGAVPGLPNFDGVIDELKIYSRERDATEIGPVAITMWETVLINSTTNIQLQGFGPSGRSLTYRVTPLINPTNGVVSNSGSAIVTYQAGGRKGPDAFAYTVSDGEFTSAPAIVTLSVVQPHWLSPSHGMGGNRDGSTPEQAWHAGRAEALDAIWKTNRYYDCFFYAPGVYETTGWKFAERSTANAGCKHIGSGATGSNQTIIRLVNTWDSLGEGIIFAASHALPNSFEVHEMTLDCNAVNNPKYALGEPVWVRIPLATNTLVDKVSLRWWSGIAPGGGGPYRFGRAVDFQLCARDGSAGIYITNCNTVPIPGTDDAVLVSARADELILQLNRRALDVDFYSLAEVEVSGATVSLPSATIPGGRPSRFDAQHPIVAAVDGDPDTAWASGRESEVEIVLPLARGTRLTQVNLHWNCRTISGIGRFGAGASYAIRARDETTGTQYDVPFVRHTRTADGREANTFGTIESTNAIVTDQVTIVLRERESVADYYSLREVSLQENSAPVSMRLPTARSTLSGGSGGILRAFDQNPDTYWASGTQGMVGAIDVPGNNLKFTRLKIIGFGTKAGRECFPMFIFPVGTRGPAAFGNILVEDCVLTEPATNNPDGITTLTVAARAPDTLTNAVIRRTTVAGLRQFFKYSHGFSAIHVEDCVVQDCEVGVYFEPARDATDDVGPVLVRSNRFVNVFSGVYTLSHPSAQFDSITCLDNEVILTGGWGWGLGACDVCAPGPSGSARAVTALNNIIRYADWQPRPQNTDGGLFYTDIRHAVFGNNLIALGTANILRVRQCPAGIIFPPEPTEDCEGGVFVPPGEITHPPCLDTLSPGYRRAWFNNRGLSGSLLDVRFSQWGVDGFASQQQWPE